MQVGIEAIEIYIPSTYVDQTDLGTCTLIQKNIITFPKENIPRDLDNSNSPSPIPSKTSTPWPSQVKNPLFQSSRIS